MNKTLHMEKEDLLQEIIDRVKEERVSVELYGTSREDAFLSGINEGIDRILDSLKELAV